ncbi:MAG: hypothetical protein V3R25_10320 [Nitrosomonadaceae bacterium]
MEDAHYTGVGTGNELGTLVTIYARPIENKEATEEAGHSVYDYKDYIKIQAPGQRNSTFDGRVTSRHKERFPEMWEAYRERADEAPGQGTPLSEWAYLNKSRVMSFHALGVTTMEALAAVSDSNCKNLGMDGMDLKKRARQYLDNETQTGVDLKQALDQIKKLTKRIETMEAVKAIPSKKRGRKPKKVADDTVNDSTGRT